MKKFGTDAQPETRFLFVKKACHTGKNPVSSFDNLYTTNCNGNPDNHTVSSRGKAHDSRQALR